MHIQKIILIVSFCFLFLLAKSQNFFKDFKDLGEKNDTAGERKVLEAWETSNSKDPELFVAYFNYYVQISTIELISIDQNRTSGRSFEVTDTGTGVHRGYLNLSSNYNSNILQKGFDHINRGIALYPERLDMRFGNIYMLGKAENYQQFTKALIETIEYGNTIHDAWKWSEGKPVENAKKFFWGSMQTYVSTIYNTGNDSLLPLMREISETVLKYNPGDVESLDNIALTYLIVGDNDKALEYLFEAEKVAPKDIVVLNNIGQAYKRKKDKVNAKIYFEKVIKYGNKEEAERAKQGIKDLDD